MRSARASAFVISTLALALGETVPPAQARASTESADIVVDATAPGTELQRVWPFHGYDEVNYTVLPEGRALLSTLVAAHTAPVHIRSHFLFNNGDGVPGLKWGSTNVYSEDASGTPVYDWMLTDGILDALTQTGAFPLVELGFMPEALSTRPKPYRNSSVLSLNGGCFYPPKDHEKWAALIRTWATHVNARYPEVAAKWLWELWNEPDTGYWKGSFADYAKLYDYTEAALHDTLPTAALGGPSVVDAQGTFLTDFLDHCAKGINAVTGQVGTRLDLVSFHAKGGVAVTGGHVEMALGNQLRLHEAGFRSVAAFPQFKQTPIYITEADPDGCAACPASEDPSDAYRNFPAYGAYEVAMMKHSLELAAHVGVRLGGVLTWAFTFPDTPYFAGYRALATNGINLPVMGAFKLLGRLAGTRLPLESSGAHKLEDVLANGVRSEPEIDGMAAVADGALRVLVWNYHDDLVAASATSVHLTVRVPARFGPSAVVSHLRVDESHGNAYATWTSQGSPAAPSAEQVKAMQEAMDPAPLLPESTVAVSEDGSVAIDFPLPRFGVSLLTIGPAAGPVDWYAGVGSGAECARGTECGTSGCGCIFGEGAAQGGADLAGIAVLLAAMGFRRRRAAAGAMFADKVHRRVDFGTKDFRC